MKDFDPFAKWRFLLSSEQALHVMRLEEAVQKGFQVAEFAARGDDNAEHGVGGGRAEASEDEKAEGAADADEKSDHGSSVSLADILGLDQELADMLDEHGDVEVDPPQPEPLEHDTPTDDVARDPAVVASSKSPAQLLNEATYLAISDGDCEKSSNQTAMDALAAAMQGATQPIAKAPATQPIAKAKTKAPALVRSRPRMELPKLPLDLEDAGLISYVRTIQNDRARAHIKPTAILELTDAPVDEQASSSKTAGSSKAASCSKASPKGSAKSAAAKKAAATKKAKGAAPNSALFAATGLNVSGEAPKGKRGTKRNYAQADV